VAAGSYAEQGISPYLTFSRQEWARLRDAAPLTLSAADLEALRGLNEPVSLADVEEVYLPLTRLLGLYVAATRGRTEATYTFLGRPPPRIPYIIGLAGSVAVGKSTAARLLRALLARTPERPSVDLVTTDGFLYPNAVLGARGLMERKGFPESYDRRRLVRFLAEVKEGRPEVAAPVYSHLSYDIVPGAAQWVRQPEILIVEGLNVLQGGAASGETARLFVSDFFDFSLYLDAEEPQIERWFVERFLALRQTAFRQEASFFHRFAALSEPEAVALGEQFWREINGRNLRENILPTRARAHLILEKGPDHAIRRVKLRRV